MTITQIVPQLPPAVHGLGDYAYKIGSQLRQQHSIESRYVITESNWCGNQSISAHKLRSHTAFELNQALQESRSNTVLLHYVSYAYATRGCPLWLLNGMRQWLAADSARRLITVFHELYASGPIYGSAFWLSPIQKHICKSLFALSTHALTTTAIYRDKLSKWGHSEKITAMPVISNVGESDAPPALSERERKLIVFGSRPTRLRAYSLSRTAIDQACRILAIDEIWDIGAPLPQELTHGLSVPCRVLGPLPADRIHLLMQRALAGFIHYKPGYWAKSGIFAAYCAHGMLPVTALPARPDLEGYASDQLSCVIDGESRSICAERAQGIAAAAYAWYRGHDIESSAGRIAGLIANGTHERILASGGAWR